MGTEFLNDYLEQFVGYSQDTPLSVFSALLWLP